MEYSVGIWHTHGAILSPPRIYWPSAGREVGPTLTSSQQAGFSGVAIALVSKVVDRPGEVASHRVLLATCSQCQPMQCVGTRRYSLL